MEGYFKIISTLTVYFSLFLPFIYLRSFTVNSRAFKVFTIYLFFIGIIQIASQMVTKVYEYESNIFVSHYYFIGQYIILTVYFYQLLKQKFVWVILGISIILLIYQYITTPSLYEIYNEAGILFSHLIIVVYSFIFLYKSLSQKLEFTSINIAILIYFISTSLIFSSGNLVYNIDISVATIQLLLNVNTILFLVFQIVIFVEWWKNYSVAKAKS